MLKPTLNVTPLIDVLLVLLIIFMVVTPLKPSAFKTRVPAEDRELPKNIEINPKTLAVIVGKDSTLALNTETGLGTASDSDALTTRLKAVFAERIANDDVSHSFADDPNRPFRDRIERTVFIKAPKDLDYGSVARVVDAVKLSGAYPISLQIDRLD
ncbi:MAG: biopolymer transporter ExbD [Pyrinomonadaceae bacterium]|nr:biopolymer transporter ExbD [Acidobacteriota bacterium]MBP7476173.1 biopolymer transporter ExbD [Pyrinomonadaceae bacterium]MBP9109376.1 biopolymer transporter ExbD [Pyrinomonadaceae bacterium]